MVEKEEGVVAVVVFVCCEDCDKGCCCWCWCAVGDDVIFVMRVIVVDASPRAAAGCNLEIQGKQ
jgi:hypothetical protein